MEKAVCRQMKISTFLPWKMLFAIISDLTEAYLNASVEIYLHYLVTFLL